MSYFLLQLDKSIPDFTRHLTAMLATGAFTVLDEFETLSEAQTAHLQQLMADLKIRQTGTPTKSHYEICNEQGAVENFTGVYANRETLHGIGRAEFVPNPTIFLPPKELIAVRKRLGLTQTEFGQYLGGAPLRTVQDWEGGHRKIPFTIAEILRLKGQL